MTEFEQAKKVASMWLDGQMHSLTQLVPGDPDCDGCVLARAFNRITEFVGQKLDLGGGWSWERTGASQYGMLAASGDVRSTCITLVDACKFISQQQLKTAIGHIEHMANWISDLKTTPQYSFESLGEDMPGMIAALPNT